MTQLAPVGILVERGQADTLYRHLLRSQTLMPTSPGMRRCGCLNPLVSPCA